MCVGVCVYVCVCGWVGVGVKHVCRWYVWFIYCVQGHMYTMYLLCIHESESYCKHNKASQ